MMLFDRLFLRHPREQGESYLEHARFAAAIGARMTLGGLACLAHAFVPVVFKTAGSRTVRHLGARLDARSARARAQVVPTRPPPRASSSPMAQ